MKRIPINSYLINIKNKDCPLPDNMKIGKGLTWSNTSIIRCAGCVFLRGISLKDQQYYTYSKDGCIEVGNPNEVFCDYKG